MAGDKIILGGKSRSLS